MRLVRCYLSFPAGLAPYVSESSGFSKVFPFLLFSFDESVSSPRILSPVSGVWRHRLADEENVSLGSVDIDGPLSPESLLSSPEEIELSVSSPQSSINVDQADQFVTIETEEMMSPKKKGSATPAQYIATLMQLETVDGGGTTRKSGDTETNVKTTPATSVLAEDYLFIAGHHLARANDKELAGDFEVAFGLYKLGIDILLRGVQS